MATADPAEPTGRATFVHDFVAVDLPLDTVLAVIHTIASPPVLEQMVRRAWFAEQCALDASQARSLDHRLPDLAVVFGPARHRADAMIIPVSWMCRSTDWVPPIDADLEFAAFGPRRTHIHLYGRSKLPPGLVAGSSEASLTHRLTVAVVRHVLSLLTEQVVRDATGRPT